METTCVWTIVISLVTLFGYVIFEVAIANRIVATSWERAFEVRFLEYGVGDKINRKFIKRTDFTFTVAKVTKCLAFVHTRITKQFFSANTAVISAHGNKVA